MKRSQWFLTAGLVVAAFVVGALVWWVSARDTDPAAPAAGPTSSQAASETPTEPDGSTADPTDGSTADPPSATPTATAEPTTPEPTTPDPSTSDPTAPPVDLEDPAEIGTVTARLVRIEAIEGEADGPGEIAGPALRVTVELTNGGDTEVDLTGVVVNLYHGPGSAPAEMLAGSGSSWLEGRLAAGASAAGVYVFTVPADDRDPVQVTIFVTPDEPTVLFEGAL